jgi:hypothetical protein
MFDMDDRLSVIVKATAEQAARWCQAAEVKGCESVGEWLAFAADAYLEVELDAGQPVPLAWQRGAFTVQLAQGKGVEVKGWISPPFGFFHGDANGPRAGRGASYALVFLTTGRVLATLRSARQCRGLAAELAKVYLKWR